MCDKKDNDFMLSLGKKNGIKIAKGSKCCAWEPSISCKVKISVDHKFGKNLGENISPKWD